jgi:Xaa-Pro dipeptidase
MAVPTLLDGAAEPVVRTPRAFASPGSMNVDWEERWNVERLRRYRSERSRAALAASDVGAVLLFDFNNIRYVTSTHIGEWARDKMTRYALLTRGGEPHIWDFGSAAKHHRLNCPWLRQENIHAGMVGLRGAVAPDAGLFRAAARTSSSRRCRRPSRLKGSPSATVNR